MTCGRHLWQGRCSHGWSKCPKSDSDAPKVLIKWFSDVYLMICASWASFGGCWPMRLEAGRYAITTLIVGHRPWQENQGTNGWWVPPCDRTTRAEGVTWATNNSDIHWLATYLETRIWVASFVYEHSKITAVMEWVKYGKGVNVWIESLNSCLNLEQGHRPPRIERCKYTVYWPAMKMRTQFALPTCWTIGKFGNGSSYSTLCQ